MECMVGVFKLQSAELQLSYEQFFKKTSYWILIRKLFNLQLNCFEHDLRIKGWIGFIN